MSPSSSTTPLPTVGETEAADRLRVSVLSLDRLRSVGAIKAVKARGSVRITEARGRCVGAVGGTLKRPKNPAHQTRDEKRTDVVCLRYGDDTEITVQGHGGQSVMVSAFPDNWPAHCLATLDQDRTRGGALCR
jgi:hypothetical protein